MKRLTRVFVWVAVASIIQGGVPVAHAQQVYRVEEDVPQSIPVGQGLVSLDFKDANLKDVLKVFSQQSGLNFVANQDVEGRWITLYMNNVSVEDALRTLLDANNLLLDQSPGSNILIVKGRPTPPIETLTRVYKIRYYHGNVPPGQYLLKGGGGSASSSGSDDSRTRGMGLRPIIESLLSPMGKVIVYMNLVIVTDVPDRFRLIDQVINEVDRPVSEVMLEVEVIETTAGILQELGVKWSGEMARYSGPARLTPLPYKTLGYGDPLPYNAEKFGSPLGDGMAMAYGLISSQTLTWILQMLNTDTNTKFLAKPRVLCQNREWAEMRVTSEQIVSLKTTVEGSGSDAKVQTEVERMEVGTILRVLPVINEEEGLVSLLLEPTISRPIDSRFTAPDGTAFVDPQERGLRTVVTVRSGETIAVGGFITTDDAETIVKVPYLGDMPILGGLFRHRRTTRQDKEMLIFITPRLIRSTQKYDFLASPPGTQAEQIPATSPAQGAVPVKPSGGAESVAAAVATPQGVAFREQEDLSDLRINMTIKGAGVGMVDLIR